MVMKPQDIFGLPKQTFEEWSEDKAPRLAAALAYYTAFALAPLLVIAIAIAGAVFGEKAARGAVLNQLNQVTGRQGAEAINTMIAQAGKNESGGVIAAVLGVGALLLGASGLFGQLQDALNTIWEVQPKPGQGIIATIKQRFFSITMVLGTGFLLLVSLVAGAVLGAVTNFFSGLLPGLDILWQILNIALTFGLATLVFALIYKFVPDVQIKWSDVGIGALVTAALFMLGQALLGLYLSRSAPGSAYGAAGSFVIILLWIYYSAQILFFGAEFTQVYANKYGSHVEPAENAIPITEEARAQQGMPRKKDVAATAHMEEQRVEVTDIQSQPSERTARGDALAGFLAGLLIGMRRRSKQ
jgi:membrane protein